MRVQSTSAQKSGAAVQTKGLDIQTVIDGMGQGVMIFDRANRLVLNNRAALTFLGADYKLVKAEGWTAAAMLLSSRQTEPDQSIEGVRTRALATVTPIRFFTMRAGERIPCWAAAIQGQNGDVHLMITIDAPDWSALTELLDRYLNEVREAVASTQGHADLITQMTRQDNDDAALLARRVGGFAHIIDVHMHRLSRLTDLMTRLEAVRTGGLRDIARAKRRRIVLAHFVEDFMEALDETALIDPETETGDCRGRIQINVASNLAISASPAHLNVILRDVLRNAIMYSLKATPVRLIASASPRDNAVQIDIVDEGYGIRSGEAERIFTPFVRARQPQIISEFGYGLSLYLCKQEIEAMGGRIWFTSEERVGTTMSLKLPLWREVSP